MSFRFKIWSQCNCPIIYTVKSITLFRNRDKNWNRPIIRSDPFSPNIAAKPVKEGCNIFATKFQELSQNIITPWTFVILQVSNSFFYFWVEVKVLLPWSKCSVQVGFWWYLHSVCTSLNRTPSIFFDIIVIIQNNAIFIFDDIFFSGETFC